MNAKHKAAAKKAAQQELPPRKWSFGNVDFSIEARARLKS
jgi:hypothetical protein